MLVGNKSKTAQSDRDLWATPWEIFFGMEWLIGRKFNLDACASAHNAKCQQYITEEQNCLTVDWLEKGEFRKNVWVNPPYSDPTPFIEKAIEQSKKYKGMLIAMLLPANTSGAWFKLCVDHAAKIWFITAENNKKGGRISFLNNESGKPQSGNPLGSMVVIFNQRWREHKNDVKTYYISRDELIRMGAII